MPDPSWREIWTALLRRVEARHGAPPTPFVGEMTINDALPFHFRRLCDDHDIALVARLYADGFSPDAANRHLTENARARERVMLNEAGCLYRSANSERSLDALGQG